METFINYSVLIAGLWMVLQASVATTYNFKSVVFFKTIPAFIGLACLFSATKLFGWI